MSRSRVLQTVVRLMERPNPVIIPGQTLVVSKEEVNLDAAAIGDGGVIVKNMWLSIDPAMRGWMSSDPNSYIPPVGLGDGPRLRTRLQADHDVGHARIAQVQRMGASLAAVADHGHALAANNRKVAVAVMEDGQRIG